MPIPKVPNKKSEQVPFAEFVDMLCKPGEAIQAEVSPEQLHLWHMATGVAGEAGLLDAFKKHVVYQKPLDLENVIEELGDLEFYMEATRAALNITREQTLSHCRSKLAVRYAGLEYSNTAAQARADKEAE